MFSFIVNRKWCSIVVSSLFKVREIIAKGSVSIGHKCGCKAVLFMYLIIRQQMEFIEYTWQSMKLSSPLMLTTPR